MYYEPEDFDVVDAVVAIADEKGLSPAQIALAWLLHKPGVTAPIIGATKMYQLEEAAAAVDISLSDEEIEQIEAPYKPHRILGH
jgi:aryl-alcohol dehydrogenase (NADP+)